MAAYAMGMTAYVTKMRAYALGMTAYVEKGDAFAERDDCVGEEI
jgi:hypothetical protein